MPSLPSTLGLGPVELTVRDLGRSVAFYQRALGLHAHGHDSAVAELGDSTRTVLVLHENPAAQRAGRHAGLFHYALLYPSREELARAVVRLNATGTPVQGASDHGTHEAIYLPDLDGNGIELAADRPRAQWPPGLGYTAGPQPLDVADLLGTVAGEEPTGAVAPGLRVGHLHLKVGDIDEGLRFYRDVLGFTLTARLPDAAFVAAGDYHHHLGFNVWQGAGVGPPPQNTVGLHHWTVELETPAETAAVRDRVEAAGLPVDDRAGGFVVRDPWDSALLVASRSLGSTDRL